MFPLGQFDTLTINTLDRRQMQVAFGSYIDFEAQNISFVLTRDYVDCMYHEVLRPA